MEFDQSRTMILKRWPIVVMKKTEILQSVVDMYTQGRIHVYVFPAFSPSSKSISNRFSHARLFLCLFFHRFLWYIIFFYFNFTFSSSLHCCLPLMLFLFFLLLLSQLLLPPPPPPPPPTPPSLSSVVDTALAIFLPCFGSHQSKTKCMIYFSIHIAVQRDRLVNHYFRDMSVHEPVCTCICIRMCVLFVCV